MAFLSSNLSIEENGSFWNQI